MYKNPFSKSQNIENTHKGLCRIVFCGFRVFLRRILSHYSQHPPLFSNFANCCILFSRDGFPFFVFCFDFFSFLFQFRHFLLFIVFLIFVYILGFRLFLEFFFHLTIRHFDHEHFGASVIPPKFSETQSITNIPASPFKFYAP